MLWTAVVALVAACAPKQGSDASSAVAAPDIALADAVAVDSGPTDAALDVGAGVDAEVVSDVLGLDGTPSDLPPVVSPVKPSPGQAGPCLVREVLSCGETTSGHLTGAPSGLEYGCSFIEEAVSSASHSYAIWSPVATLVTLRLSADGTAQRSLFARSLAALEDACDPSRCDAWSPETVVPLAAGEVRYVSLSSVLGEDGDYTVAVSCCTPSCDGRACGDDGCGGSCGECTTGTRCKVTESGATCAACVGCVCTPTCAAGACGDNGCGGSCGDCAVGHVCASGTCTPPTLGQNEGCSSALAITSLPFEYVGTTESANDDLSPNGPAGAAIVPLPGCLRANDGGPDAVFRYTASAPIVLVAELAAGTGCASVAGPGCGPGILLATRGCPFDECVAATDVHTGGPRLVVPVAAKDTVYLVVEGYDADERGPYRLRVTSDPAQ
ncbi:MAG: hypothetical protein IV100_00960 [Myxococcales bacterium]|nr:hypothetical protein [Myxococcales bacterium]